MRQRILLADQPSYADYMKLPLATLLFLPALVWAAEPLPDTAPPEDQAPQTRERPFGQPLLGEELEALYLQSPLELDISGERQGLNALSPDSRYLENEQQEQQRRRAESFRPPPVDSDAPKAPPPTLIPLQGL